MRSFKIGEVVIVKPLEKLRIVGAIRGGRALCIPMDDEKLQWFGLSDLRQNDPPPFPFVR